MSSIVISTLSIVTAFLTSVVAAFLAWIAYRQYVTANAKLNLDLFEKRMAVYEKVRAAVRIINAKGRVDNEADRHLLEAIGEAEFLFGEDIRSYLDGMWERFNRLNATQAGLDISDEKARCHNIEVQGILCREITQFYYEGSDIFAHYMRMDQRLKRPLRKIRQRPSKPA